ncbi:D6-type cyclin isoform 1 [Gossypium australe]|uniref:D6-type cyclin isoform 1 n=1 Tax=Gossypium australe TaxID=47621 RepID=A0A5B6WC56_9ROSI|nr:D6-type cyclin isoform 1 [Gossypium australe]
MEYFDLEDPFTTLKQHQFDTISTIFSSESDHMPCLNYLQCLKTSDFHVSFRQEAMSLVFQAQYCCNLDPYTTYLAVTYMDRFISKQEIPVIWSCFLTLMTLKQREEGFIFDASAIQRMELLVLDALNWRMRTITPFSFICFFISLFELKDPPLIQALKDRATHIIFQAGNETNLLEFKPSTIAASALLMASHELLPLQFPSFKASILCCEFVNEEKLLICFNAVMEMVINEMDTISTSSTVTPISVLDCHCNKSETEMSEKKGIKRHKLIGFCSESKRVKMSHIQPCG